MLRKIFRIYLNANKSIFLDENNKVKYIEISLVYIFILSLSIALILIKKDKFLDDPKILAMLLSLFSGLMYSVLLKIPDKLSNLKTKEVVANETLRQKKERVMSDTINNQVFNYLKNFSYTLSYSILVAIFCILLVIISSFFPVFLEFKTSNISMNLENYDYYLTAKVIIIVCFRFAFISFMLQFLYFITKSVIFLTDFTLYEFKNLK